MGKTSTAEVAEPRNHSGVALPKVLFEELRIVAREDSRSVSSLVTKVMTDFLRAHKSRTPEPVA